MLKITAPRPVTAKVVGVAFVDGVATVDEVQHRAAVAYFRRRGGYVVQAVDEPQPSEAPAVEETPPAPEPPTRSATKAEWKAYAISQGIAEADAEVMTRDQLAEKYLGPKGD